ncbi:MAG: hypothetical protein BGO12_04315 [Verrucomicrobia bacterium 61-8]|nr:MAG: hypothetical protein BGO12_04315 [Verrucomicrobia bacterium 61-8]
MQVTLSIKSYPARNGDAYLIKTDGLARTAILVDGGYPATFHDHIRADLVELARQGYGLDLVVATHIDADHISGLLAFFKVNGRARAPKIIPVRRVLHNSLRSLSRAASPTQTFETADRELLDEIQRGGFPAPSGEKNQEGEISARQGSSLAVLLRSGGYLWNEGEGKTTIDGESLSRRAIGEGYLTVLGPPRVRLEKLLSAWTADIRRLGFAGLLEDNTSLDDAFEFLSAERAIGTPGHTISGQTTPLELKDCYDPDDSVPNGSSITFIFEIGSFRVLFLGDSWAEDTESALRKLGDSASPMLFDAIKISHHGSLRNTSTALLNLVDAPIYFISTNGEGHGHPDFAVLAAIVDRPGSIRELFFNYPTSASGKLKTHVSKAGAKFYIREGFVDWIKLAEQPVQ